MGPGVYHRFKSCWIGAFAKTIGIFFSLLPLLPEFIAKSAVLGLSFGCKSYIQDQEHVRACAFLRIWFVGFNFILCKSLQFSCGCCGFCTLLSHVLLQALEPSTILLLQILQDLGRGRTLKCHWKWRNLAQLARPEHFWLYQFLRASIWWNSCIHTYQCHLWGAEAGVTV